jgi:hypothetical protein
MDRKVDPKKKAPYKKPAVTKQQLVLNQFSYTTFFDDDESLVLNYLAAGSPPSCCILPETHIRMYDGTEKQVQDIRVGDVVLSYNQVNGTFEQGRVRNLLSRMNRYGYYLINKKLKVTADHPMWVKGREWLKVKFMKEGDIIQNFQGKEVTVTDIQKVEESVSVYNISVESKMKTYFADDYLTVTYTDVSLLPYHVRFPKITGETRSSPLMFV